MLKKTLFCSTLLVLIFTLTGCRSTVEDVPTPDNDEDVEVAITPEQIAQERREAFEAFHTLNHDEIARSVATEGEDIRIEIGRGNEFLMFIRLEDVELNDDNRSLYNLTFGLSFSEMSDFFEELAEDIRRDANVNYFRLTVIFTDITGSEIARSNFDVGDTINLQSDNYEQY